MVSVTRRGDITYLNDGRSDARWYVEIGTGTAFGGDRYVATARSEGDALDMVAEYRLSKGIVHPLVTDDEIEGWGGYYDDYVPLDDGYYIGQMDFIIRPYDGRGKVPAPKARRSCSTRSKGRGDGPGGVDLERLAWDMAELACDVDTYDFKDNYGNMEEAVEEILPALMTLEGVRGLLAWEEAGDLPYADMERRWDGIERRLRTLERVYSGGSASKGSRGRGTCSKSSRSKGKAKTGTKRTRKTSTKRSRGVRRCHAGTICPCSRCGTGLGAVSTPSPGNTYLRMSTTRCSTAVGPDAYPLVC